MNKNLIRIYTTNGILHYYQVYKNETFKELYHYFITKYDYPIETTFIYKGERIPENQKLSAFFDVTEDIVCLFHPNDIYRLRKKRGPPLKYGFNLYPDPCYLPPRPESQTQKKVINEE